MLRRLGAEAVEVRAPEELEGLDGLVIPGGESTTIDEADRVGAGWSRRSAPTTRPGGRSSAPAPG